MLQVIGEGITRLSITGYGQVWVQDFRFGAAYPVLMPGIGKCKNRDPAYGPGGFGSDEGAKDYRTIILHKFK